MVDYFLKAKGEENSYPAKKVKFKMGISQHQSSKNEIEKDKNVLKTKTKM